MESSRPHARSDVDVLSLDPRTLTDVADSIRVLAHRLGAAARGRDLAAAMLTEIGRTAALVRDERRQRVFFAEWIEPPFCAGHWLPEMIELAGGEDVLGRPGEPSSPTTWADVMASAPELVISGRAGSERRRRRRVPNSSTCHVPPLRSTATRTTRGRARDSRRGVRQLAHLLHPELVPDPGLPAIPLVMGPSATLEPGLHTDGR